MDISLKSISLTRTLKDAENSLKYKFLTRTYKKTSHTTYMNFKHKNTSYMPPYNLYDKFKVNCSMICFDKFGLKINI